jgi:hypothetical protein
MTTPAPTPGVIARWTTRRPPRTGDRCDECGTPVTNTACAECGQLAGRAVGMLATVVETPAGRQLVIAQRTGHGDWTPVQTMPATIEAVRAVGRPGATGPFTSQLRSGGRLW